MAFLALLKQHPPPGRGSCSFSSTSRDLFLYLSPPSLSGFVEGLILCIGREREKGGGGRDFPSAIQPNKIFLSLEK
jgi:hypothetical protein